MKKYIHPGTDKRGHLEYDDSNDPMARTMPRLTPSTEHDAAFMAEIISGLKSARSIAEKYVGDHAAMVCMRLDQAIDMLPALVRKSDDLRRAYNECWAGSPAVKEELENLRAQVSVMENKNDEIHRSFAVELNERDRVSILTLQNIHRLENALVEMGTDRDNHKTRAEKLERELVDLRFACEGFKQAAERKVAAQGRPVEL